MAILLELVIGIGILGIVASGFNSMMLQQLQSQRITTAASANIEASLVSMAASSYHMNTGEWPASSRQLSPGYLGVLRADYSLSDNGTAIAADNVSWKGVEFSEGKWQWTR